MGRDTIGEKGGKTPMVVQGVGHHRQCAFREISAEEMGLKDVPLEERR